MTLRPEYSLGHSRYNDFLFATVRHGPDAGGDDLTVLSALTRLQVDPWNEAARLADLSPEMASRALAATLARLPELNGKAAEAVAAARRLVALLPAGAAPAVPITPEVAAARKAAADSAAPATAQKPTWITWLVWAAAAVAALTIAIHLQPDNNLESFAPRTVQQ